LFLDEPTLLSQMKALEIHEIGNQRYFYPGLNHLDYTSGEIEVSDDISSKILCLPLYHSLSMEEQRLIARLLLRNQNN